MSKGKITCNIYFPSGMRPSWYSASRAMLRCDPIPNNPYCKSFRIPGTHCTNILIKYINFPEHRKCAETQIKIQPSKVHLHYMHLEQNILHFNICALAHLKIYPTRDTFTQSGTLEMHGNTNIYSNIRSLFKICITGAEICQMVFYALKHIRKQDCPWV